MFLLMFRCQQHFFSLFGYATSDALNRWIIVIQFVNPSTKNYTPSLNHIIIRTHLGCTFVFFFIRDNPPFSVLDLFYEERKVMFEWFLLYRDCSLNVYDVRLLSLGFVKRQSFDGNSGFANFSLMAKVFFFEPLRSRMTGIACIFENVAT